MISDLFRTRIQKMIGRPVKNVHSVSGGSINRAAKITVGEGQAYFLKWNGSAPSDMFPKEQKGLELLQSAGSGLRVPDVLDTDTTDDGVDFILIEFIREGSAGADSHQRFGEQLAALHQTSADQFGLDYDNYIGRLPQSNAKHENWIDFFVEERLKPQLRAALDDGKFSPGITQNFQRLYNKLPDILADEPAGLLHGDLWGGNFMYDEKGAATVYDPAVYYGNREIELAFTHLFGGFSPTFYEAYEQMYPLQPGFNERRDIYNLYPLLVHTNMFGGHYARQVQSIVARFA